jgi:hypothetical protein
MTAIKNKLMPADAVEMLKRAASIQNPKQRREQIRLADIAIIDKYRHLFTADRLAEIERQERPRGMRGMYERLDKARAMLASITEELNNKVKA